MFCEGGSKLIGWFSTAKSAYKGKSACQGGMEPLNMVIFMKNSISWKYKIKDPWRLVRNMLKLSCQIFL